jgi:predicted nucleic acid-binding protein
LIVIDASATIALLLNEDRIFENSERLFDSLDEPVIAPNHWVAEVGNALVINVRRGRVALDQFSYMVEQLVRLEIRVNATPTYEEMAAIAGQASEWNLTYYDAAYVHAALASDASLLTLDRKMRLAASQLNVRLLPE